ncbi:PREDICTED: C4b-binding protein alpha chain [Ceratotherium simum simum]|uniref:C4b-binding protein alpha chain n=1 Tax=Ceratotherium simum simum TaxID=73337 RepID=A0ABM0HE98_CERSS|nr:PREDICTED: C4b-binding protein alpha chain [Ceratotherium simum simum]
MWEKHQVMQPPRAPNGTLHRKEKMAAWLFSRLWRVSDPTLFQMTMVTALLATVLGDCGPPPTLYFASPINELNETNFETGTVLKYACRPGYSKISSRTQITCQPRGMWQYSNFCTKKRCRNPGELHNGQISKTDLYFGSRIEFSCSEGSMIGKASISCTVENKTIGVWRPSPPTCKNIVCRQPQVPNGIFVSGFGPLYSYKDSIVFDCKKGYILNGSSLIHCEADNNWDPPPPICELNACTNLPDIPHASWEPFRYHQPTKEDLYDVGTVLKYHCQRGYKPASDEPTTVICQENFRWTPYIKCEEVCCPEPELKNGKILEHRKGSRVNSCGYFYGDTVTYSCFEKKKFSATCQGDGMWHPKTPFCDYDCNFPPTIDHGRHKEVDAYSLFTYEFIYECDEGYTLVGQARLSCRLSQWSSAAPQCKALCLKPRIEHGQLLVVKDQYITPENVTVQCDSGYGLVGPQSITCSEDRTWYPEVPKCEWEVPEGCEQVVIGRKLMKCLPSPEDVKMALELYKLYLEIELLQQQLGKEEKFTLKSPL